jgi:hypothetical protein
MLSALELLDKFVKLLLDDELRGTMVGLAEFHAKKCEQERRRVNCVPHESVEHH